LDGPTLRRRQAIKRERRILLRFDRGKREESGRRTGKGGKLAELKLEGDTRTPHTQNSTKRKGDILAVLLSWAGKKHGPEHCSRGPRNNI